MERQAILDRERRWARPAAAAAILGAPLNIASVLAGGSVAVPRSTLPSERFRAIDAAGAELFGPVVLRGLGFLLVAAPLLYLFRAVRARNDRVSGAMVGFAFIGPVLLAAQGFAGTIAQGQVASDFVAQAAAGGDVYTLLENLVEDSTALGFANSLLFPAVLGMLVVMIYFPLQAMRAGLLTRFFGTLGMALGVGILFVGLLPMMLWFVWLGLVFLDRTPGPRPPAWDAGVAIPWPRPGEEPAGGPPEEPSEDLLEGEAIEVTGDGARDRSPRRERERKRKRKRRR